MSKSTVIPYIPSELASPWCVRPGLGRYLYGLLNKYVASGSDLQAIYPDAEIKSHDEDMESTTKRYVSWYNGDIAVVEVNGTVMKNPPPSFAVDKAAITYPKLVTTLTHLVEETDASRVILKISSFGGSAAGAIQTMDAIRDLQQQKPIIAFIDDYACSGGYFLASQCTEIVSAEGADIGSIGVLMVLTDDSKRLEDMGLKLTVVSTGEYKGLGADGKVSQKLVDEQQGYVDEIQMELIERVRVARGLTDEEIETVTDGSIYRSEAALNLNLIDRITNWHKMVDVKTKSDTYEAPFNPQSAVTHGDMPTPKESTTMSDEMKTQLDALTNRLDTMQTALSANETQIAEIQVERDTAITERDNVIKERDDAVAEKQKVETQQAMLIEEQQQQQMDDRRKACATWVVAQCDKGLISPAAAPKLNALLCALTPVTEDIEISYIDNAKNAQTETGQVYELAQEAIEAVLTSANPEAMTQFEEQAHSRVAEGEGASGDASQNPYVKRLEELGVKIDTDNPLAKAASQSAPENGNRTGIQNLLTQVDNA